MELTKSEILLIKIAHLSLDKHNKMIHHDNIWKAFRIGIDYEKQRLKEQGVNKDEHFRI